MGQGVELIPLVCLRCATPVPANSDEVAWVCAQCGQGLLLDENTGLQPLDVYYVAALPAGTVGRPFWVADGQVSALRRETYSGNSDSQAQEFWSQPHRFFVPAYQSPLEDLLSQAVNLLVQPPALQPGPAARFQPVTLCLDDVTSAAEFIVVAIEAGRKDKLKEINFNLQLSKPALWILP